MTWRDEKGLTLFELVIAMGIFALVAVMGLQSLTATMRARDQLVDATQETGELSQALSLLRADLASMVPIPFAMPGGGYEASLSTGPGAFSISVAGQRHLSAPGEPAFHRVTWRVDPQSASLERFNWPTLIPASPGLQTPSITHLRGVSQLEVLIYRADLGWVPLQTDGATAFSTALPEAIQVAITSSSLGRITMIETFR